MLCRIKRYGWTIPLAVILLGLTIGVRVDRLDADVGDEILVNDDNSGTYQGYADVAVGPVGQFIVVWGDQRNTHRDIYLQSFDRDGNRNTSNRLLIDELGGNEQFDPRVGTDGTGRARIVWADYRASGYPLNPDIYLQTVDAAGEPVGINARVNTDFGTAAQVNPDIAVRPDGQFWIVWEDFRNNRWDIYGQKYTAAGSPDGGNVRITDPTETAVQHRPTVAFDGSGNALVVWYDNRGGNDDIFGQFFAPDGSAVGANVRISAATAPSEQRRPDASGIALGGFVVAWTDYRAGPYPNNPDIYVQRFDGTGNPTGTNIRANTDIGLHKQRTPRIAAAADGEHIVFWRDDRAGNADVYGRRFAPDGSPRGDDYAVATGTASFTQSDPSAAISDTRVVTVWTDDRNGSFDVYTTISVYSTAKIGLTPSVLNFTARTDETNPQQQTVAVTNIATGTLEWVAADDQPWLGITPISGTAPSTMTVTVNPTGLALGAHTGLVAVKDRWDVDSAESLLVVLNVTPAGPIIAVAPQVLTLTGGFPDSPPPPATLHVANDGVDTLNFALSWPSTWLTVDKTTGTAPDSIAVAADIASLAPGTVYDTLSITDPAAGNSPLLVPVTLTLSDNAPVIAFSPDTLSFTGREHEPIPSDSTLLLNAGNGVLTVDVMQTPPWLTVSPFGALAPQWFWISVEVESLTAGTWDDTLWFESPTASNSPYPIAVTATLDSNPTVLAVAPESLTVTVILGENPPNDTLTITNAGAGNLDFSLQLPSWGVDAMPSDGAAPAIVELTLTTDTLPLGEYHDTIVVASAAAVNAPIAVPMTVSVEERPPQLSTGIEFHLHTIWRGDSISVPDRVVIENSGGGDFTWAASADATWIALDPILGAPGDTLVITLDTPELPAGVHTDTITVADTNGIAGTAEIIEEVTVREPDTLTFGNATVAAGAVAVIPIFLSNVDSIIDLEIGIGHDAGPAWLDSVGVMGSRLASWPAIQTSADSATRHGRLYAADSGTTLPPGNGPIGFLWMSTGPAAPTATIGIDTISADLVTLSMHTPPGLEFKPVVVAGMLSVESTTGILDDGPDPGSEAAIRGFALGTNYPNPFNNATVIPLTVERPGVYTVTIYDVLGRQVRRLVDGTLETGVWPLTWDATGDHGRPVSSGIYFANAVTTERSSTRKLILLR